MKSSFFVVLCAALVFNDRLFAADTGPQWKVQVTGIRVVAPPADSTESQGAFFSQPGTVVAVTVTAPAGKIVSIETDKSKLETFTDDKGGNLLAAKTKSNFFSDSGFTVWSSFSEKGDGSSKAVEIHAPGLPAKGATQISISGKLAVQTASQTKQFTADDVALKPGTKVNFEKLPMTISSVRAEVDSMEIALNAKQSLDHISQVDFFDTKGNKIESDRQGSSSWSSGDTMDITQNYQIKKSVDKVKIVITCWTDLKTTEVPISIKTGVGL